jgi:hypothetical protein
MVLFAGDRCLRRSGIDIRKLVRQCTRSYVDTPKLFQLNTKVPFSRFESLHDFVCTPRQSTHIKNQTLSQFARPTRRLIL